MVRVSVCPRAFVIALACCCLLIACGDDNGTGPEDGNHAPVIDTLASVRAVTSESAITLTCTANDPDADSLTYAWLATGGSISGSGATVTWTAPEAEGFQHISVTVTDEDGNTAADTFQIAVDNLEGTLLAKTRAGLWAVDALGNHFVFHSSNRDVEVLGERIFLAGWDSITELDHDGNELSTVESDPSVSGYCTLLPDEGFAIATNNTDLVYMVGPTGAVLDSIPMPNPSVESLQNIDGIVVGNRLIISENGNNEVFAIDLTSHDVSIFRSVQDGQGWLGAIDYDGGTFYLCRSQRIHTFTEDGPLQDLCELPVDNITGITAEGHFAYVVLNFAGALYRVDRTSGEYQEMLKGLDYPQDIEYVPVKLFE